MENGTVRWFNKAKRFGYISRQNGEVVFVHSSAIQFVGSQGLKQGQAVRFSIVNGPRGLQAESVAIV